MWALAAFIATVNGSIPLLSFKCWLALCLSRRHTWAVWPETKQTSITHFADSIRYERAVDEINCS